MTKKIITAVALVFFCMQITVLVAAPTPQDGPVIPKKVQKLLDKAGKAMGKKDFTKARELLEKALAIDPKVGETYFQMANWEISQKKFKEAINQLNKAIEVAPTHASAITLLARIYNGLAGQEYKNQNLDAANGYYAKVVAIPNVELTNDSKKYKLEALFRLGVNHYLSNKPAASNENLQKFVAYDEAKTTMNPQYLSFSTFILGVNYAKLKDTVNSDKYLNQFMKLSKDDQQNPNLPIAYLYLGANEYSILEKEVEKIKADKNVKDKDKKKKIAELAKSKSSIAANLEKSIEMKSDIAEAYPTLGNYYYHLGENDKAIKAYSTYIEKFPNAADVSTFKKLIEEIKKASKKK